MFENNFLNLKSIIFQKTNFQLRKPLVKFTKLKIIYGKKEKQIQCCQHLLKVS